MVEVQNQLSSRVVLSLCLSLSLCLCLSVSLSRFQTESVYVARGDLELTRSVTPGAHKSQVSTSQPMGSQALHQDTALLSVFLKNHVVLPPS